MSHARGFLVALLLALSLIAVPLVAGCGEEDPDGEGAVTAEAEEADPTEATEAEAATETTEAEATTTTETAEAGTRQNPLPVGETAVIGEWEVTVTEVNLNANEAVAQANQFNEPPAEGQQYVLVTVNGTYVGEESGTFWIDLIYRFYGSGGNTFDQSMAVAPNPIIDTGETFPGASVSGNLIFEVPSDQVKDGAVIIEEAMALDSERVFFAVQ